MEQPGLLVDEYRFLSFYGGRGGELPGVVTFFFTAHQSAEGELPGGAVCRFAETSAGGAAVYGIGDPDRGNDQRVPAGTVCEEPAGGL